MSGQHIPEQPLDVVAWITCRLHANGTMSIQGTIGERRLAHQMLDHAKEAITRQVPDERSLVVPNRDVEVAPPSALRELGNMAAHERGDP